MGTFKPDYAGIGRMLKSPEMQEEMMRRARLGLEYAVATAPFDPDSKDGTHYKEQFRVEATPHDDRAAASLINDDEAAFQIEFGTRHSPKHRTLGKALDVMAAG